MSRPPVRWRVAALDGKVHDRAGFDCGTPDLDRYLKQQATQDVRRDVARVFVAMAPGSATVLGYFSLSAASFRRDGLPPEQARRLPHYPVPAALLGRLAVDRRCQGQGLGSHLLMDALTRVLQASQALAIQALVVEAKDAAAASFYAQWGFARFADDHRRLFLPLATIRALIE